MCDIKTLIVALQLSVQLWNPPSGLTIWATQTPDSCDWAPDGVPCLEQKLAEAKAEAAAEKERAAQRRKVRAILEACEVWLAEQETSDE